MLQEKVFLLHSYIIFVPYEVLKTISRATILSLLMKHHHEKSRLLGSVGKKEVGFDRHFIFLSIERDLYTTNFMQLPASYQVKWLLIP